MDSKPDSAASGEPKKGPAKSYWLMVDRTTKIEVAIWPRELQGDRGMYTVYSLTLKRSFKDAKGNWQNPEDQFYRLHELPTLQYLIAKAYDWVIEQKMKSEGNEE